MDELWDCLKLRILITISYYTFFVSLTNQTDFVNVPQSYSVDTFRKMVVENGGKFSMNLNNSVTHCIAAESSGMSLSYSYILISYPTFVYIWFHFETISIKEHENEILFQE